MAQSSEGKKGGGKGKREGGMNSLGRKKGDVLLAMFLVPLSSTHFFFFFSNYCATVEIYLFSFHKQTQGSINSMCDAFSTYYYKKILITVTITFNF